MSEKNLFQSISTEELKKRTDTIEIAYQLIAVTLIYGDIVIGGLEKHWTWNGQTVNVGFNTSKGERFEQSRIIQIGINLIGDIQPIPLSDESLPKVGEDDPSLAFLREMGVKDKKFARLAVQDYPNPLASVICEHNLQIAAKYNLSVFFDPFIEKALSMAGIPTEGIKFDKDYLLYADWEFFQRQMPGGTSIGGSAGLSISKNLKPSLQTEIIRRLRNTWKDKTRRKGETSSAVNEIWIEGCILVPTPPEDTQLEGEKYILVFCVSNDSETYPVLLKPKALQYPQEFIRYIISPLVFYGELLPIPIIVLGEKYENTLVTRAIGYFHS